MRRLICALLVFSMGCISAKRAGRAATRTDLGTAYLREGDPASAVRVLREATKLNPRNAQAWEKLALAYMAQGAPELSDEAFTRAVALDERAEVHNNYGLFLSRAGRADEAIPQFEAALSDLTYRSPAIILSNLSYALYLEGRHDEALARVNDSIRRANGLCQGHFNKGLILKAQGKPGAALDSFELVVSTCPDTANGALLQAATLLLDLGDRTAGCAYLKKVQRDTPPSELHNQAANLIAIRCG